MYLNAQQKRLFNRVYEKRGGGGEDATVFKRSDITDAAQELGIDPYLGYKVMKLMEKVSHGVYDFSPLICLLDRDSLDADSAPKELSLAPTATATATATTLPSKPTAEVEMTSKFESVDEAISFVPDTDPFFVKWGNFSDLEQIVSSGMFYPTFVTGLTGNGKTLMVEQVCAKLGREMIRIQVTPETDEGDLIGSFQLIDGNTVFVDGPVTVAMERGVTILIDELDRGTNKLLALQGILEGKPVLIKKTGRIVKPQKGFNIIATANTKGKGSDDGQYIAANIMDEAFLERFAITIEQPYPSTNIEKRIVEKTMEKFGKVDTEFAEVLTLWAEGIRKLYQDGGLDEIVSTRRLCHIVQTNAIFNDHLKAVRLGVARFDEDVKEAFISLFEKIYRVKVDDGEDDVEDGFEGEAWRYTQPV